MADLDVRRAWKVFGGKSLEGANQVFLQNPFGHVDNFRWIAPAAFIFYFPIVVRYATSEDAKGDSDTISSLSNILESQLEENCHELSAIFGEIAALCQHIISHYSDYDLDYDIYGDLKCRYEKIAKEVEPSSST